MLHNSDFSTLKMKSQKVVLTNGGSIVGLFGAEVEIVESGGTQLKFLEKDGEDALLPDLNRDGGFAPLVSTNKAKTSDVLATGETVTVASNPGGFRWSYELPPFDSSTDAYKTIVDQNGNYIYILYDKHTLGNVCLNSFNSSNPLTQYPYLFPVGPMGALEYSKAYFYGATYNNGSVSTTRNKYYNAVVWNSNSFGGWIYIDSQTGYGNTCQLASRDDTIRGFQYFNFKLLSNGLLQVRSNISRWSTDAITTTSPVPMNEWVYIQAYQFGNSYKVGWKRKNGAQHIAQGNIVPLEYLGPLPESISGGDYSQLLQARVYSESATYTYAYNFYVNNCPTVKARNLFWQPGDSMFANVSAIDTWNKEIGQYDSYFYILTSTFLSYLDQAYSNPDNIMLNPNTMFTTYLNPNTGGIVFIDFRGLGCEGPFPLN